jgi:hypothetical protein
MQITERASQTAQENGSSDIYLAILDALLELKCKDTFEEGMFK